MQWDTADYLLALVVDLLSLLAWMQTKDGKKNRKRPKPIGRPGTQPTKERIGDAQMTLEEVGDFMRARRAMQTCSVGGCSNPPGPEGPCLAEHTTTKEA